MYRTVRFAVAGTPRPKGSLRHVGKGRLVEQTDVKRWMGTVRNACQGTERLAGPVHVALAFVFERPKTVKDRPYPSVRSTGDLDKLCRAVLDAIQPKDAWPGIIDDDSQVVSLYAAKEYGPEPGVHVIITEKS